MAQELKHVGRVIATNKKCIVVYRTLPGDAYHCLIVATENLPDIYHDSLINLVESGAGQDAYEFAEALDRSQFPDGSNMLRTLHRTGKLLKAPTGSIEMTPTTGFTIVLSELNQIIAEQRGVAVDSLSIKSGVGDKPVQDADLRPTTPQDSGLKTTSQSVNEEAPATQQSFDSPEAEAKYYRSQADKLAKEAAAMRRKAEELVPTKKVASAS